MLEALRTEIAQGQRTGSAAQAGEWLTEGYGVRLSVDRLPYQRTSRSLRHKQDPAQVEARTADLAVLEKGGMQVCSTCATSTKRDSA